MPTAFPQSVYVCVRKQCQPNWRTLLDNQIQPETCIYTWPRDNGTARKNFDEPWRSHLYLSNWTSRFQFYDGLQLCIDTSTGKVMQMGNVRNPRGEKNRGELLNSPRIQLILETHYKRMYDTPGWEMQTNYYKRSSNLCIMRNTPTLKEPYTMTYSHLSRQLIFELSLAPYKQHNLSARISTCPPSQRPCLFQRNNPTKNETHSTTIYCNFQGTWLLCKKKRKRKKRACESKSSTNGC